MLKKRLLFILFISMTSVISFSLEEAELKLVGQKNGQGNTVWSNDSSDDSFAVGYENTVIKNNNERSNKVFVVGRNNTVGGKNSVVLGDNNNISGNNVYTLGSNITSNTDDSIIVGNNSTGVSNALSVGNENNHRKIVFVKEGKVDDSSSEAINGSQLFHERSARQEGDRSLSLKLDAERETRREQIINLDKKLNNKIDNLVFENSNIETNKKLNLIKHNVASAVAMANLPTLSPDSLFSIGFSYGRSSGANAFALGITGRTLNKKISYKTSLGISTNNSVSFGMGISYSISSVENELSKDNKKLNEKISKLEKELEDLKSIITNIKTKVQ